MLRQKLNNTNLNVDLLNKLTSQFTALDKEEQKIFKEFNEAINLDKQFRGRFSAQSADCNTELLRKFQQIKDLDEKRINLATAYLLLNKEKQKSFWEEYKGSVKTYEIFTEFTSLIGKKLDSLDALALKSDILKLITYPSGEQLIEKICERLKNKNISLEFNEANSYQTHLVHPKNDVYMIQNENSKLQIEKFAKNNFLELKRIYGDKTKNQKGKGEGLKKITFSIPTKRNMHVYIAVHQEKAILSFTPYYRFLYHELTHVNRALNGSVRGFFNIPSQFKKHYQNAEEFWAINIGKHSEATLSKEDGFPVRVTHSSFPLFEKKGKIVASKKSNNEEEVECKIQNALIEVDALLQQNNLNNDSPHNCYIPTK